MAIETVLAKQEILSTQHNHPSLVPLFESEWKAELEGFARAIEQAILQSPEIRALRRDKERYQQALERISIWGRPWTQDDLYGRNWRGCAAEAIYGGVDAAMEQQK